MPCNSSWHGMLLWSLIDSRNNSKLERAAEHELTNHNRLKVAVVPKAEVGETKLPPGDAR